MSELTNNVKPLDDFNWEEFENGTSANVSKEELDKAYDETLNKVSEHQVTEGTVNSVDKKEVIVNSGFSDEEYEKVGAEILPDIKDVYAQSEMIVKVKEPIEPEYDLIRKGQLVFTYFHFACDKPLTDAMIKSGGVCLAYETVQKADRSLPLLIPMSEVAGRMAALNGAFYLQKTLISRASCRISRCWRRTSRRRWPAGRPMRAMPSIRW